MAVGAVGAVGVAVVAVPAGAGRPSAEPGTPCAFSAEFDIDPGLSVVPNSGTFTTGDETGTMDCSGPVDGRRPTGTGRFGAEGRYGTRDPDSCLIGGEGTAVQTFSIPTAEGARRVRNPITFTYHPVSTRPPGAGPGPGPIAAGEFRGPRYSGTFDVTALKGDCVTAPVTRVRLDARGVLAPGPSESS
jgi:hypothetical protein